MVPQITHYRANGTDTRQLSEKDTRWELDIDEGDSGRGAKR